MTSNDPFFDERKIHTTMKLEIFKEVLNTSIGIANNALNRNYDNSYSYMDLYSGIGFTKDGKKGSPLIALDVITNHLQGNNNFKDFDLFLFEKNEDHFNQLKNNIRQLQVEKIKTKIIPGDWHETFFKTEIPKNHWGFIFSDPYADHLILQKQLEAAKTISKADMLIFFNLTEIKKKIRKGNHSPLELFRDIQNDYEEMLEKIDNQNFILYFEKFIRNLLSENDEKFIINATLPVSRNGILANLDYSFLTLISGQQGVINAYLKKYNDLLDRYSKNKQYSIFGESLIEKIYKKIPLGEIFKLYDFLKAIWDVPIKWTEVGPNYYKIPTLKCIREALNERIKDGSLSFVKVPNEFLLKKQNGLSSKAFNKLQGLKRVKLMKEY
jgi:three-Cys-motif partner protein